MYGVLWRVVGVCGYGAMACVGTVCRRVGVRMVIVCVCVRCMCMVYVVYVDTLT